MKKRRILLIQVDGKKPNLALMKFSGHHKDLGHQVFLNSHCNPDKVYISCIFSKNKPKALGIAKMFNCAVEIGGYGVNDNQLPYEIEHRMPDYSLYGIDYSIGYTSRGCVRQCPWCIVPTKEGRIKDHAPISEFLHPTHKKLILYDNNFLASPNWSRNLKEIISRKLRVNFNQGLDIRLIDQENARMLAKSRLRDDDFQRTRIYYAFDTPEIESQALKGIRTLKKVGFSGRQQMCYVLVGYNTSYEEDLHRVNLLIKQGVMPYVMPYNDRQDSYYPHLERWVNGRYYQLVPWEEYDSGNSQKIIKQMSY